MLVWTAGDSPIGDECVLALTGRTLKHLTSSEVERICGSLSWVVTAIDAVDRGDIPFVPSTQKQYLLLSDAFITLRLRQRGDRNAQPVIPNNPEWVKLSTNAHLYGITA